MNQPLAVSTTKEQLQLLTKGLLDAIEYGDHLSIKRIANDLHRTVTTL